MADVVSNSSNGDWLPSFMSGLLQPSEIAQTQAQTAQTQANIPMLQAQTQGLQLQNQLAQMRMSGMPSLLSSLNGGSGAAPGSAPGGSGSPTNGGSSGGAPGAGGSGAADPGEAAVAQQFQPVPTARPAGVAQRVAAASILYGKEAGDAIGAQYDAQVAGINQSRQLAANQAYQSAAAVDSAPPGQAQAVLERINPDLAAKVEANYKGDSPEQMDADLRGYAQKFGLNAYQYSGRSSHFDNGTLVDDKSGAPVVGSSQILTGLTAADKQKSYDDANSMVTRGAGLPEPKWQAAGYPSASAYVIAADKSARTSAAAPAAGGAAPAAPTNGAPGGNLVSGANAPPAAPARPTPAPSAAPTQTTADPVLTHALADPAFRQVKLPTPTDQPSLAAATDQAKATVAARTGLLQQAATDTSAAATADTYLAAAQAVLKGGAAPPTGLSAPLQSQVSRAMQALGITSGDYATRYQEVAKYLGNAALQNARQTYGARMTQKEVDLQLHELSPSTAMTPAAVSDLINQMRAQNAYATQSAARTGKYLAAGNDPQQFEVWNQKYYPRQQIVDPLAQPAQRSGQQTSGPVRVTSPQQAASLPSGTTFITPDGRQLVKR